MTFEAFMELYENDMRPRLKENTWLSKKHMIRTKLFATFGKKMLSEIETRDIIAWQNELRKEAALLADLSQEYP